MTENKPVHSMNYGTLQVSIWEQQSDLGDSKFYRACFNRTYKDNDTWCKSRYFLENDLPVLAKAILDAHTWIQNRKESEASGISLPAIVNDNNDIAPIEN